MNPNDILTAIQIIEERNIPKSFTYYKILIAVRKYYELEKDAVEADKKLFNKISYMAKIIEPIVAEW